MPKSRRLMRLLLRPVVLALGLAQLAIAIAPAGDRAGRDARAHVEIDGTNVHVVHDETACPACQAQHLIGRVVPNVGLAFADLLAPRVAPISVVAAPGPLSRLTTTPRAPPLDRLS